MYTKKEKRCNQSWSVHEVCNYIIMRPFLFANEAGIDHPTKQSTRSDHACMVVHRVSKTVATVQNRNSSTKNDFCIFGFRNIKYKKIGPGLPSRIEPETEKNPETDGSHPVFETLVHTPACMSSFEHAGENN